MEETKLKHLVVSKWLFKHSKYMHLKGKSIEAKAAEPNTGIRDTVRVYINTAQLCKTVNWAVERRNGLFCGRH